MKVQTKVANLQSRLSLANDVSEYFSQLLSQKQPKNPILHKALKKASKNPFTITIGTYLWIQK